MDNATKQKIVKLLITTDMSIAEIALRMRCAPNSVGEINRKYQIRDYGQKRSVWTMYATTFEEAG